MNKLKITECIALLLVITQFSGCSFKESGRGEIKSGGKNITTLSIKNSSEAENIALNNEFAVGKIDKYEGVKGEDWLNDGSILITKENSKLEPIAVFDQMSNIRNIYSYDLKSKEEKSIYKNTEYMLVPIVSPNNKYIFSENLQPGKYSGLILDLYGNVKATVEDDVTKGFHISFNNARWINNEEVIVPSSGEGVCIINVNSNITKIENIGRMQTDNAIKLDDKIYYISVERKLIEYNINTKQSKVVKDNVNNFELSPQKDMFAIEKRLSTSKDALVLIDLNGNEKVTLIEAKTIFGISWSPDQSKLAYVLTSEDESKNGLYITDISGNKSLYVSPDFVSIENGLKWNPSSKKILASIGEVKDMKYTDNTYVISLK